MSFAGKEYKKICVFIALAMTCIMITACGAPKSLTKDYAVGLWKSEYNENGKSYIAAMAINDGGEYGLVVYVDGEFTSAEIGTYSMNDEQIILYKSGETTTTIIFDYSSGYLINEGHKFVKQENEDAGLQ